MMPIRRTDDEDNGAGAPPVAIRGMDSQEKDDALSMEVAANVELIRAAATRRIAESQSQRTPSLKNGTAAQNNFLRQHASQGSLAQQSRVPAPPLNRPLPPLAPRAAPKEQDWTAPNSLRRPQSLKRDQPHQGHPVANDVLFKMPNVVPSSTPTFYRHIENVIQEQGPPGSIQLPADVNPDITTLEYVRLMLDRGERAKTKTSQAPVAQLPVGQALETFPFQTNASEGMSAVVSEQLRGPDPFRRNASGSTSADLPKQRRAPEPRKAPEPRREPEPSNEVRSSKSEAERKRDEHLAVIERMEQEILDEEEEAEREAEAMNAVPTAPVPVKQSYRPAAMPGPITQRPLFNGAPVRTMESVSTQSANADYMEPIDVIWKQKTVTLPNLVKCIKCHGLMSLYMDLRNARDKKEKGLLVPAYQCLRCQEIRPIGAKFHPYEAFARAAWPAMEFNDPATQVRNFDEEVEKRIGEYNRRNQRRREPRSPVVHAVENPRVHVPFGNTATYSLAKLVQKVLVVAGRVETEDAEIDEGMLNEVSAKEFMDAFTTFLADGAEEFARGR
ncbi:hypothetical protein CAEBREN_20064 [Caenorhabditis brenneri]|uniref:Uncharacterized protein n=1 Tax=Caenorhabditis brenneri TaxID=135651 RepID=G0MMQ6_CAEBE|nr:hypothetical protein CAEBREN_20064 [Caenorhabditis brenneri]